MTKFVILCFPRTGSYLFVDLLDAQQGIVCHGEIFKDESVELRPAYRDRLGLELKDAEKRDADPVAFYESVFALSPENTTGFKIFPNHKETALRSLLLDKSIRKIFLARNPVQSFVSLKVAQKTGSWINRGQRDQGPTKVRANPHDLILHVCRQRQFYDRCRIACGFNQSPFLLVDYADLRSPEALDRVATFLGMTEWDKTVQTSLRKQIKAEYPAIVENWPAVERMMRQTKTNIDQRFLEFTTNFMGASFPNSPAAEGAGRPMRHRPGKNAALAHPAQG